MTTTQITTRQEQFVLALVGKITGVAHGYLSQAYGDVSRLGAYDGSRGQWGRLNKAQASIVIDKLVKLAEES
jgi:hypothetical protein